MTDSTTRRDEVDSAESDAPADLRALPAETAGVASTDAYEVDGGVVLFDVENPLAWVEADEALELEQMT